MSPFRQAEHFTIRHWCNYNGVLYPQAFISLHLPQYEYCPEIISSRPTVHHAVWFCVLEHMFNIIKNCVICGCQGIKNLNYLFQQLPKKQILNYYFLYLLVITKKLIGKSIFIYIMFKKTVFLLIFKLTNIANFYYFLLVPI